MDGGRDFRCTDEQMSLPMACQSVTSQYHHPATGGQCIEKVAENVTECRDQEQVPGGDMVSGIR